MIRISVRDIVADLPPSILKKRIKEIDDKNNIINITGVNNYTPEVIQRLRQLFEEGRIQSYPVLIKDARVIFWTNKKGFGENDRFTGVEILHRPNNLPAWEGGEGIAEYFVNGKRHRTDGPAVNYPSSPPKYHLNGLEYSRADWEREKGNFK